MNAACRQPQFYLKVYVLISYKLWVGVDRPFKRRVDSGEKSFPNWGEGACQVDDTGCGEAKERWGRPLESAGHVYLIDDDSDIRAHVGALLRLLGYEVKTFASAKAFIELDMLQYPAVVILDMCMPGLSGLQVHRSLRDSGCRATILYLSGNSERQDIIDAMKAGAVDFLWKPVSRETLALAVSGAMMKSMEVTTRFAQQAKLRAGLEQLSTREREVFEMMVSGLPNRQIATRLGVRADTVKKHRTVICEKFMVEDTAALIAMSREFAVD